MQLFGSLTSPYVRHCRIALMQGNINFELISTNQIQSAELIATQRVPFLKDDGLELSDSASIIRFAREQSGFDYLTTVKDLDQFCLINTALDSTANIFYLEKFGLKQSDNEYILRQNNRIHTSLIQIEKETPSSFAPLNDWHLRLACFLDWAIFRKRINSQNYPELCKFLQQAQGDKTFALTHPTE